MKFFRCCLILLTSFLRITYNYNEIQVNDVLEGAEDNISETLRSGDIVFSCMIFRNGDRYPLNTFPSNSFSDVLLENGLGVLTQEGKMQAFNLGRWTRKRYDLLINQEPYDISLLQIISSGYDRTISTADLFLAGFWPPTHAMKEIWNEKIDWQPVSVLTNPRFHDRLILPTEYCARFNLEVERLLKTSDVMKFLEKYAGLIAYVREHTGVSVPENDMVQIIFKIIEVYDCLRFQKEAGLELPEWAKEIYPNPLQDLLSFREKVINPEILRLKGGPLLGHITKQFTRKRDNPQLPKLFQFYVGHNTTIMTLLQILGLFNGQPIPFCSSLFIELRLRDKEYFVTISYREGDMGAPKLLELNFCPYPCALDDFIGSTEDLIPKNWEKECKSLEPDYNTIFF